jgi:DNA uptake protein ComE-like DNA-binding protein
MGMRIPIYSAVLEELEELMNHPLNINNVSRTELEKLRFLSPAQIDNLLNYRNKVGQLFSTNRT